MTDTSASDEHDGADAQTFRFYATQAETYASRSRSTAHPALEGFLTRLPAGARILELGCGGGHDSLAVIERGFDVIPTDGSPEMAAQAEARLGRPVRVLRFDELDEIGIYDGVWANACLLHVPRSDLVGILERVHRAVRPGGIFYASYKAGDAEGRDGLHRYYNYPSRDWLARHYAQAGWHDLDIEEHQGGAYDGEPTGWLFVTAVRDR